MITTISPLERKLIKPDPLPPQIQRIADMLTEHGIKYSRNQPMVMYDNGTAGLVYVDFYLPTYRGLIIDYIEDMPESRMQAKLNLYHQNSWPAVMLKYEDIHKSNWQEKLYDILHRCY